MKLVSFWQDTATPAGDFRRTPVPEEADVAVVGAGFTGLTAALELARGGANVVVLEANTVGWGASGRNGGMATTGLAIGLGKAIARYGRQRATSYYLAYDEAISTIERLVRDHAIDCDFRRHGKLALALTARDLDAMRGAARCIATMGELPEVTVLGPGEIHREIGSDSYHGGMVDPRGAGLHPAKFVHGLASGASTAGAVICEAAPVVQMTRGRSKHVLQSTRGEVRASEVLIATSGYTSALTPWLRHRIIPVGSFIICTEPLGADLADDLLPHRRMAADSKLLINYFRRTPDDRLLFGGRARFAGSNADSDRRSARILQSSMTAIFPQLSGVRIEYSWGGMVDLSMDRMVHQGVHDGVHYSVGYSGHGVQMATYAGQQIGRKLLGRQVALPFEQLRFPAIPGHLGRPWFLPLIGAGAHLIDGVNLHRGRRT